MITIEGMFQDLIIRITRMLTMKEIFVINSQRKIFKGIKIPANKKKI